MDEIKSELFYSVNDRLILEIFNALTHSNCLLIDDKFNEYKSEIFKNLMNLALKMNIRISAINSKFEFDVLGIFKHGLSGYFID